MYLRVWLSSFVTFYKYCFDAVLLLYFCSHSMTASGCLCALHSITAASGYSYSNVFPARGFHGSRRCTQVLHWQLALKMRNAWENGERGAEQGCKCNDEGGVGYATQSINIFFLIFPIASIIFFFLYISTFYLSSWQEPTTRRLLKWNYKEVVVSSGTWKWLNEKPLEQYQSAKCALCALDFPPFCCPSGVGLLIDNIIKN